MRLLFSFADQLGDDIPPLRAVPSLPEEPPCLLCPIGDDSNQDFITPVTKNPVRFHPGLIPVDLRALPKRSSRTP